MQIKYTTLITYSPTERLCKLIIVTNLQLKIIHQTSKETWVNREDENIEEYQVVPKVNIRHHHPLFTSMVNHQ